MPYRGDLDNDIARAEAKAIVPPWTPLFTDLLSDAEFCRSNEMEMLLMLSNIYFISRKNTNVRNPIEGY